MQKKIASTKPLTKYARLLLRLTLITCALSLLLLRPAPPRQPAKPAPHIAAPIENQGDVKGAPAPNITTEARETQMQTGTVLARKPLRPKAHDLVPTAHERAEAEAVAPDQPDEAEHWRTLRMLDEHGQIAPGALLAAWAAKKRMPFEPQAWPALSQSRHDDSRGLVGPFVVGIQPAAWTWLGPGNIGGRIRSIVVHPTDPQTLWVGSVGGGIWKTNNGGTTWTPLDDFMANLAVGCMAIDPTNPNVLYAGTGEGYFNGDSIRGAGIFKTTDGGTTWTQLSATANASWYYVNRLAINPGNSQIVLAATATGIWRSADGGTTWSLQAPTLNVFDVAFNPQDGTRAIASGNVGARYSTDGGLTWNTATGLPTSGRIEVAYARSNPTIVYAGANFNSGEVYRSTDGGQTYTRINANTNYLNGQGWYDNAIWVDPTNSNTLIVGGLDLWRSTDGGLTFTQISRWQSAPQSAHADQHVIVESPQYGTTVNGQVNHTVFFGDDGGIYRAADVSSVTLTSGWASLNNNLGITQFYGGAGNATSGRIVGGTQDNGTLRFTGNAQAWNTTFGGDGGNCAADPSDANYLYGEYVGLKIHRSTNGGLFSSYIYTGLTDAETSKANFIAPFILDPNNPNTLLAGGDQLWRSTNAKATTPMWTAIKPSDNSNISTIAVAKGNSDIIWVGHNNGDVFYTVNGTAAAPVWVRVDNPAAGPALPNRYCTRIALDPVNPSRVYVTFGGFNSSNVWRTDTAGASWTDVTSNLPNAPVYTLAVWQQNPNNLYVGTEVGIFASANGGQSWSPSNDGPTNCSVDELFWMDSTLVAATHGRGLFSIQITNSQPPSVSLSSPASGASFITPAAIPLAASASDPDGSITKVEFFANSALVATATSAPYTTIWHNAAAGSYVVTAKATDNSGDATVSIPINITVNAPPPANDKFASAQVLSGNAGSVLGTNVGATREAGEPLHGGSTGGASVWYQWQAPASGSVTMTTSGSNFDTLLGVYTGTSVNSLTTIASNDDESFATGILTSKVTFTAVAGTTYRIAVDGFGGQTGDIVFSWSLGTAPVIQFSAANYSAGEGAGSAIITVTRTGSTTESVSVTYATLDDPATVRCDDTANNHGAAYARCDYATTIDTLTFAPGETSKSFSIPLIDDAFVEGPETVGLRLSNSTGATLGQTFTATLTITDNDQPGEPNPIDATNFFVRQHYLDFLSREPDTSGFNAWTNLLNNCSDVNNNPQCDRLTVSQSFYQSQEFQLKGFYVYRFYKLAFNRLPDYTEIIPDMRAVTGSTAQDVFTKKSAFANSFVQRPEFTGAYGPLANSDYVSTLLGRYQLTQITTPDPAHPDGATKVTLDAVTLTNQLGSGTLTRAQVLRAIADSDEVAAAEFNQAFVAMQYYGYLRRTPEPSGYQNWLNYLNAHPTDTRTMVNGFVNSIEYRLRFGPVQ